MIKFYLLAFNQLKDPRFIKPLIWSSILSIGSLGLLLVIGIGSVDWLFDLFSESIISWFGDWGDWIKVATQFLVSFFLLAIAYFFFGSVHAAYLGLFLDDIIDAVRDKHYPGTELNPAPDLLTSTKASIRFVLTSLMFNILASPLFLLGWFFPPSGLILQIWINGLLLGREYGYLIEQRIPNSTQAEKESYTPFGMLAETIWLIPVINLLSPILLSAAILHRNMNKPKEVTSLG